jgi:two-component system sensor histidine kinase MprB
VIVQLDEVVDAAVDRAARSGRRDRIIVHSDAVEVTGDAHDLDRAIANLLDNALKYGADTDIQVRVGRDDPWAVVEVRDHGPGIAPDDLQKVFDRFYRAPAARAAPGSGLGLAIVDQIANRHGGVVRATNAPEGGAVMTLQLPLATHTGPGV